MREADAGVFESGRPSSLQPVEDPEPPTALQGPGGDSRPDRRDPGGFDDIEEDARMTTTRHPDQQPEVQHEDPERLEAQRVDQDDEIVGQPLGPGDEEINVLRPRISKKGAESSQL